MSSQLNNEKRWRASLREFRSPRAVAFCGVMCALSIVLGTFATINLGPYLKIGLSGLPNQVVDYLFGPVAGAIFSGATGGAASAGGFDSGAGRTSAECGSGADDR